MDGVRMKKAAFLGGLKYPGQRLLFTLACAALIPWLWMRLVRELWVSSGVRDYLGNVFVLPVAAWVDYGWLGLDNLPWYDSLLAPALVALLIVFLWPITVRRVINWICNGSE